MPALEVDAERYRALERDHRLLTRPDDDVFAWRNAEPISCGAFLGDVAHCMANLPDANYLINLCTDRYRFSVAFFAAAARGQTTLLPSQRNPESIADLRKSYTVCRVIADSPDTHCDQLVDFAPGQNGIGPDLSIAPEHIAALAFTSGSTGTPQAHPKSWQLLCAGRATHARYLAQSRDASVSPLSQTTSSAAAPNKFSTPSGLVSTVPSWHMYGLEWAMMLPTIAPITVFCGPDFFPSDVVAALNGFSTAYAKGRNLLVSTPVHLRALLKSPKPSKPVSRTLSATSPLDSTTIGATEAHLSTQLFEIYGCSEIGSLAVREPNEEATAKGWEFFDIFEVALEGDRAEIKSSLLPQSVTLADRFGPLSDNRLQLLGRASDLVKVAGKRESLARLNNELLSLPGVDDGVVYQPEAIGVAGGERLAAFVVGHELDTQLIRQALAARVDAAFVPRPIRIVESLPRDTTSKLKITALKSLAERFADD